MTHSQTMIEAVDRIDQLLKRRLNENLGPGLSLALTTRDELITARTYGVANEDTNEPVTEQTLFQIGSITKHFTAMACLRLVEQGRLDVNAPITEYLDWYEVKSRFDTPVTIHHLLTHTSGLVMMIDCYPSSWWQTWVLRDTELGYEPGSKFSYSNVGYNVLQCVIQTITGQGFDAALSDLIFKPLGMNESYGEITNSLFPRMAKGHKYGAHDDRPVSRPEKQMVVNWYELSEGCASVVTTPTDLGKFLRLLLNGARLDDGSEFLKASTFNLMTHAHAEMDGFFRGTKQGYGVLIEQSEDTNNRRRVIGGGENLGFEASMYGDFDAGVGVILFCNSFDIHWKETRWIMDTLIAAAKGEKLPDWMHETPADPTLLGKQAVDYVGSYSNEQRSFVITEIDGHLRFTANQQSVSIERTWGDNFFVPLPGFDHAMLSFGRNEEGAVVEAFQLGDWYRNEAYEGPDDYEYPAEWNRYVGHYRSFGVLVTNFKIFVRRGHLMCQCFSGYVDQKLTDLGDGWFRNGDETSPEKMTFDCIANGKALRCRASGCEFYRIG